MENKLQNFCELRTGEAINWDKMLSDVKDQIDNRSLNYKMIANAHLKSMDWVTCACGNLCDAIPRDYSIGNGQPQDSELSHLGGAFPAPWGALKNIAEKCSDRGMTNGDVREAKEYLEWACGILERIERRSTRLLIDMGVIKPPKGHEKSV